MPNPNALVDRISNLSPSAETLMLREAQPPPQFVTVNFQGGRSGRLDMSLRRSAVWAQVLDSLRQSNQPAYLEIDPENNIINQLLLPYAVRIGELTPMEEGDIEVEFIISQAAHYLRRANPDFDELQTALQTAQEEGGAVLVTETDNHEIIDVRPLPEGIREPPLPSETPPPPEDDPVSPERAQDLFDLMNAISCDPITATAPCLTFLYPDDGCYARAHKICHLMSEEYGEDPEKIWIYASAWPLSSLNVQTANHPSCEITWRYHVAPTLEVNTDSGIEKWVIDPSLFTRAVTENEWRNRHHDAGATLEYSDASIYYKARGDTVGTPDDDLSDTEIALTRFRNLLMLRSANLGPPPYSCPISRNCTLITDRSTFGEDEVVAMLEHSTPAIIEAAFYVVVDGFSPEELDITSIYPLSSPPTIEMTPPVSGMSVTATRLTAEEPAYLSRRQRLTWTYQVEFTNTDGFTEEDRSVTVTASISSESDSVSDSGIIYLISQPNPYEIDGPTSWLSTDLRVFQINEGGSRFGVRMGSTSADASTFIKQVIENLNAGSGGETFEDISDDQQTSRLELSEQVDGTKVFNFAVARVRYRAEVQEAENVRVFFRLFPVSTTSLEYNQSTTYRHHENTIPLLGVRSGRLITIPCFAEERIDTSTTTLTAQTDPANVRDIPPDASGSERQVYFGCWLDINQLQPLFPREPDPVDGPFSSERRTIQELIRGQHQCLVAEIAFTPPPIPVGSTPGQSDKLAQRNLAIVESDNPGDILSHRIPLTFEIQPTSRTLGADEIPDELMIDWGNTPNGSKATIYLPGINSAEICSLATELYKSHRLTCVDEHTIQCPTGGITYLPIPPDINANLAGLLSVDLPETVKRDQAFRIIVRQVTTAVAQPPVVIAPRAANSSSERATATRPPLKWRRILGSFQLTIPVRTKEVILKQELRLLSVLRWIQKTIPEGDIWFPVFQRYVGQIADRVDALGGDSSQVVASPSGDWQGVQAQRCRTLAIISIVLLAVLIVGLGILSNLVAVAVMAVFLAAIVFTWVIQCQPKFCSLLRTFMAGAGSGALILAIALLLGATAPQLVGVLVGTTLLVAIAALLGLSRQCF